MFVVALLVLYPTLKKLLDASDPRSPIPELLKTLGKGVSQFGRFALTHDSEVIPAEASHPLFILRDIAIKTLAEDDEVTTIRIVYGMSERLDQIVSSTPDAQERRNIIDAFLLVWRSLMLRAIRLESEGVLLALVDVIKAINVSTSKREFMWYETLELHSFHTELISRTAQAGFDEVAKRAIYLLEGIFEWNVPKNLPPADELYDFNDSKPEESRPHDSDKELKWHHLTFDFIGIVRSVALTMVDIKSETLTAAGVSVLDSMLGQVAKANLTDRQKGMILAQTSYSIKEVTLAALEKENIAQFFLFLPALDRYTHEEIAVSDKDYSKYPFIFYRDIFKKAIEKGKLSSYIIDTLRMLSFRLRDKLKQGQFDKPRKLLFFLIDLIDDIRTNTQDRLNEQDQECYIAAYDTLQSIQEIVTDLNDKEVNERIKKSLKKFSKIQSLKKTQDKGDGLW
jgi:hypothetical protein